MEGNRFPLDWHRAACAGQCMKPPSYRHSLLILVLGLTPVRHARAEDAVTYKYQDYHEADGRIAVQVHSALIEKELGPAMQLKVSGVIDAIAGATPTGQPPATPDGQVPLSQLEEERKAWALELSRQFSRYKITVGAANSRESDYVSNGWSLNGQADFNARNTTVLLGVAGMDDDVKVFFQPTPMAKHTVDMIAGVTQLLDPVTSVTFNLTYSQSTGYLSDPYKLVQKRVEVLPGIFLLRTYGENRPDSRRKWIVLAALNRAWPKLAGAVEASYRFHRDDHGLSSHTLNLEWYQKLGARFMVRPALRYFTQQAADYYFVSLTGTPIAPTSRPTGAAPYYSADYRLSALRSLNYGLKVIWTVTDAWQVDAAVERYEMHGRDGLTAASAYPRANIVTAGIKFAF